MNKGEKRKDWFFLLVFMNFKSNNSDFSIFQVNRKIKNVDRLIKKAIWRKTKI